MLPADHQRIYGRGRSVEGAVLYVSYILWSRSPIIFISITLFTSRKTLPAPSHRCIQQLVVGKVVFAPRWLSAWSASSVLLCWSASHQRSLNHLNTRQEAGLRCEPSSGTESCLASAWLLLFMPKVYNTNNISLQAQTSQNNLLTLWQLFVFKSHKRYHATAFTSLRQVKWTRCVKSVWRLYHAHHVMDYNSLTRVYTLENYNGDNFILHLHDNGAKQ